MFRKTGSVTFLLGSILAAVFAVSGSFPFGKMNKSNVGWIQSEGTRTLSYILPPQFAKAEMSNDYSLS